MKRTIVYIDGFNLYYGLHDMKWRRYYWLNLRQMSQLLLRNDQVLTQVRYFTSIVEEPYDKNQRQAAFLDALRTLPNLTITKGKFVRDSVRCRNCGYCYTTFHEKMTDVNIANAMLIDAIRDLCDVFILISGDSDLVNPIRTIRDLYPEKRLVVIFPPHRKSEDLAKTAHGWMYLPQAVLRKSIFPDPVRTEDGFLIHKPSSWA